MRRRRLDLGLLQKEVAEQLGVSESSVWNWERNRAAPALWQIPKIIQFLGYSPLTPGRSLPHRLAGYRRTRGLSQKKLAKSLGIDPGTLATWEVGTTKPQGELLNRIRGMLADHPSESHSATP